MLTGQRIGEVSGINQDELDLQARLWTIPGSRSKNKHKHAVPLSDAAVSALKEMAREVQGPPCRRSLPADQRRRTASPRRGHPGQRAQAVSLRGRRSETHPSVVHKMSSSAK